MEFSKLDHKNLTGILTVVVLGLIVGMPGSLAAQDSLRKDDPYPASFLKTIQESGMHLGEGRQQTFYNRTLNPVSSGVDQQSLDDQYIIFNQDQSWNRSHNSDPAHNFALYHGGKPAGNINGDSSSTGKAVHDYIVSSRARNEKTAALEDQVWKTAVFFGGNSTGTPDQIIYRRLIPVGDLNGDGYADAVGLNVENSLRFPSSTDFRTYIYRGTGSGYEKTNVTSDIGGLNTNIIGFLDINGDGYDDILTYDSADHYVRITWGRTLSGGNFTAQNFDNVLTTSSKSLMVDDVDQDNLKEIVELSGFNSDGGQINVIQIDTSARNMLASDAFVVEQTFAYNAFYNAADDNRVHLVDVNGDNRSEILISSRFQNFGNERKSYLVPYDKANGLFQTTPVALFKGRLSPAGDLNGDGNHDFIVADTTDNRKAHIAYGPDDLNTALSLDVNLSGVNVTDWTWRVAYNRYGNYGDLDGDGVDDALMDHEEWSAASPTIGRRILKGSATGSHTSVFHQYPEEKFYSRIFATEELGDLNGDGFSDFAMVLADQRRVEIYFGGATIAQTPDLTLNADSFIREIASGDYTGDGVNDIALLISNQVGNKLDIYEGGSSLTKLKTINATDFQADVEVQEISGLNTIGDVNGDGNSDFIVGSGTAGDTTGTNVYLEEAYIFYGGTNPALGKTLAVGSNWSAEKASPLGDMDGDGLGDFAINIFSAGEVRVYLSGSDTPVSLTAMETTLIYGWDIAAGDFNNDNIKDLAVTAISAFDTPPTLLHIYHGSADFDNSVDQTWSLPDFSSGNGEYVSQNMGELEVIHDFNNDGNDELILGSSVNSHAALFTFSSLSSSEAGISMLRAPNAGAGLGGNNFINVDGNMAAGDFNGNGELDIIVSQVYDNNDAYSSSRVYRYALTEPIRITKVEDVPDDQGNRIRIHAGGIYMDALKQNVYGLDNWSVWRMTKDSSWTNVKTVSPSNEGASFVDVTVNKNQPTGVDSVDYSYTFRLEAFSTEKGVIARSDTASGRAFDNLAPSPVADITVQEESDNKVLSWKSQGYQDIGEYIIYKTDISGNESGTVLGTSTNTSFSELGGYEGVQIFGVKARDVNNNVGEGSAPAMAVYPSTVGYDMSREWNLIGIPVEADAAELQSMMENISNGSIYAFDGVYKQVETLQPGKGYWVKFSSDNRHEITGMPATELTLELEKGWNLVSGVESGLPLSLVRDPNGIIVPGTAYSFNQSYSQEDTLRPGRGYWLKASSQGTVTFTHPKLIAETETGKSIERQAPLTKTTDKIEDTFEQLVISDGDHERTLYFGGRLDKGDNKEMFSLPPLPPGRVFDARFKNGGRLSEKNEVYIKISKLPGSTLTLETKVQSLAENSRFIVKEFGKGQLLKEYTVEANEKIALSQDETDALYLAPKNRGGMVDAEIPDKFELKQNYPNPFNPTTQIRYAVPEASDVTLEVFNVLGKKVATLVNEQKEAGTYDVTFDGSQLASGIYLYRLKAGSYVSIRKFILAK